VAGLAEQVEAALRDVRLTAPPIVRVSREQQLSLSFAQQRLWFLDQLEQSSSFYNLPAAVRLRGMLNVAALEQTLSEVMRRHEALRTTFVAIDGEPRQVINPFTPITLPIFDVSDLDPAEREAETRRVLSEEASRPFDLARGPLVRACLVRLGAQEHVALVTMHHIISDGWSTGIFIREVAALYKAFLAGEESSLAELPIQYADFAHWQRNWLQGEVLAAQLDYWREALAEMPAMLDLPTDHPRPPEATFNGAEVSLALPAELTSQLKALSQRERVTLFMTLLAAFQSLLFRHSGQDDIVVGTPIANRRYRELEDLNGFFVNTLALRARSLKTLTFIELLQRVREVTLAAYAHQDLPFERVVEELQPERDLSRNPLFQVNFALQNAPFGELELPGLTLQEQELEMNVTRFDLECHLWEDGELLRGLFIYNTDLFDHTTIQRMVVNFETLLHSIVANPGEGVASLRLLSPDDERQLLYGWNDTSVEVPQLPVHELFERQVERTPHDTAVVFEDVSLTFLELNQRSNRLAARLQRMGVGADTVVGVMLERSGSGCATMARLRG
jgi:aspartate racemase